MDARVVNAFTRVLDALLPAHDVKRTRHLRRARLPQGMGAGEGASFCMQASTIRRTVGNGARSV
jgi:hypothetical protein